MNTLLKAIRDELKEKLPYLNGAVYITPEGSEIIVLPKEAKLPCVIVKDGREDREYYPDRSGEVVRHVRVSALVEVFKAEESIVGGSNKKGVIDILSDIDVQLTYNQLALEGYTIALLQSIEPSEVVELESAVAVKKTALYEYHEQV